MQTRLTQTTKRGLVVSDLHLFARRSHGEARFDSLKDKLAEVDVLVLNGDIFDFRWSTLPDEAVTVAAALDWLRALADRHPHCEIHFIQGNHDCLTTFRDELIALAARLPRLHCHTNELRLGSALFLHGDCANRKMDAAGLRRRRARWEAGRQSSDLAFSAYVAVDRFGITRRAHEWIFPRKRTVRRIAHYLDRASPDWRRRTRDCYFGHTHLPFAGYCYDGIAFHNTGSAIQVRGMGFNPLFFDPHN